MKWVLKLCTLILGAVILLSMLVTKAYAADDAFVITDYDVHAVISETNVYDIMEVITVNFS